MQKPIGQWSKYFTECVSCHQTDRPHFGRGLCRKCYLNDYNTRNAEKVYALRDKWYRANVTREQQRIAREQRHYGGLREAALKRDGYRCQECGSSRKLTVHHKDGQGRGKQNPNNKLENLKTLCRRCHIKVHRAELEAGITPEMRQQIAVKAWITRRKQQKGS